MHSPIKRNVQQHKINIHKSSVVAETGDRLATIDMDRKEGSCCAPFAGRVGAESPSNSIWPGQGLPPCQVSSWSIQLFGHNTPTLQRDRTDRQHNGPIA